MHIMEPIVLFTLGIVNAFGQIENYGIDVEKYPHLKDIRVKRDIENVVDPIRDTRQSHRVRNDEIPAVTDIPGYNPYDPKVREPGYFPNYQNRNLDALLENVSGLYGLGLSSTIRPDIQSYSSHSGDVNVQYQSRTDQSYPNTQQVYTKKTAGTINYQGEYGPGRTDVKTTFNYVPANREISTRRETYPGGEVIINSNYPVDRQNGANYDRNGENYPNGESFPSRDVNNGQYGSNYNTRTNERRDINKNYQPDPRSYTKHTITSYNADGGRTDVDTTFNYNSPRRDVSVQRRPYGDGEVVVTRNHPATENYDLPQNHDNTRTNERRDINRNYRPEQSYTRNSYNGALAPSNVVSTSVLPLGRTDVDTTFNYNSPSRDVSVQRRPYAHGDVVVTRNHPATENYESRENVNQATTPRHNLRNKNKPRLRRHLYEIYKDLNEAKHDMEATDRELYREYLTNNKGARSNTANTVPITDISNSIKPKFYNPFNNTNGPQPAYGYSPFEVKPLPGNDNQRTFNGNQGTYNGNQGTFNDIQGLDNGNRGAYNGNQGTFNDNQGFEYSNRGTYYVNQRTFNDSQGFDNGNRGTYNANQGTFNGNQRPYNGYQGTYNGNQGVSNGYPSTFNESHNILNENQGYVNGNQANGYQRPFNGTYENFNGTHVTIHGGNGTYNGTILNKPKVLEANVIRGISCPKFMKRISIMGISICAKSDLDYD